MLVWVGGVVEQLAAPAVTSDSLWYVWPDSFLSLLFIPAFLMICRDLWRVDRWRFAIIQRLGPRLSRA
jgi:hypothetical protein